MRKKIIIIISIVIVILLIGFGFTKALFTSNSIRDYYLNSKGFYFETDYDKNTNVYNFWDGSRIEYEVSNFKDDKYTEDDINYEVRCVVPNGIICKINGKTTKYESTLKGGKESTEDIYLDVETNDKDVEVEVITKSLSPYSKTIRNRVLLHKDDDVVGSFGYELVNYNNYSLLNISNYYNQNKCVDVKWNNTDLKVSVSDVTVVGSDSNGYVTEFTKNISSNDTVSIKFYNEGNTAYDKRVFQISECSLES